MARRTAQRLDQLSAPGAVRFPPIWAAPARAGAGGEVGPAAARGHPGAVPGRADRRVPGHPPLQYRLFDRLYRVADDDPATAPLMTATRSSRSTARGADIYSYSGGAPCQAGRHHALGTNYRSTKALVGAVNAVSCRPSSAGPARPSVSVVRLSGCRPRGHAAIRSGRRPGRDETLGRGDTRRCRRCRRVAADAAAGRGTARDAGAPRRRAHRRLARRRELGLPPRRRGAPPGAGRHRVVLVRNRREAEAVRRALRRAGVASVYLSGPGSRLRHCRGARPAALAAGGGRAAGHPAGACGLRHRDGGPVARTSWRGWCTTMWPGDAAGAAAQSRRVWQRWWAC